MTTPMFLVMGEVAAERLSQDKKWGEQNHGDSVWGLVLGEEYGESCRAALDARHCVGESRDIAVEHLRRELIQVAAVAVAWVEAIDRRTA